MAQYRDIEHPDGRMVRLYRPPHRRIIANVEKRHPRPLPPVKKDKTATGREIVMRIDDDPDYLAKLAEWEAFTAEQIDQMGSLFMFKDEVVPDDWDVEAVAGEEMRYFDPEWGPREGPMGRKLDYIEWDVLADLRMSQRANNALAEMSGIDLEEVKANEASFRDKVEEPTAS